MRPIAITIAAAGVVGVIAAAIVACTRTAADIETESRLLVLDGLVIHRADVEPYVAFLDSFIPEGGRKVKIERVLEDHILPLFVARRAFADVRARLRAEAEDLCSVATNVHELDTKTANVTHRKRRNQTRMHPRLPVAMFLFDPLLTGSVSSPIEVAQGYIVAAAFELHESPLLTDDFVDGLQVGFVSHTDGEWLEWYEAEKRRLADKATFVHPDFREAMPKWIQLPRQP